MGSIGKVVEFDPKNVCTKFCVNQTYRIGVMNFKVKNSFSSIIAPPSGRLGSNYLGSICPQLPNEVQNFMSLPFTISREFAKTFLKTRNNNNNTKPAQKQQGFSPMGLNP